MAVAIEEMEASATSSLGTKVEELKALLARLPDRAYSIHLRLEIAKLYQYLGYPDLAAGDAYKALLLIDEVGEEGEYHEEALEAAEEDLASGTDSGSLNRLLSESERVDHRDCCCIADFAEDKSLSNTDAQSWATTCWRKTTYSILIECLINCGCLRSAFNYSSQALKAFPDSPVFKSYQETLTVKLKDYFTSESLAFEDMDIQDYPDKGHVRRELYPWNDHEPDRYSAETLEFLNDEMAIVAPKLEVRVTDLPLLTPNGTVDGEKAPKFVQQLGVFVKDDLSPGEVVLQEKSVLTAVGRLHEFFCDACSGKLPEWRDASTEEEGSDGPIACEECDEVFFCSSECHELAESYHPAVCGASTTLENVPAKEAADSLYSLLLVRALAMAETQDVHPLDLKEVKFIWGDYHTLDLNKVWSANSDSSVSQPTDPFRGVPQTLPFSFDTNVLRPLHMLEKMDINIFTQSHRYDTWIFNTLYAKFRGTASARQGLDGRPEVSAVHPLWCLANHSCDPNVSWEWQGSIKFWVREKMVEWKGRPDADRSGIRKGEELLNHYCDVTLPLKERREWAIGPLGGNCMCRRCIAEEMAEGLEKLSL